jgi:hypothetical protein
MESNETSAVNAPDAERAEEGGPILPKVRKLVARIVKTSFVVSSGLRAGKVIHIGGGGGEDSQG